MLKWALWLGISGVAVVLGFAVGMVASDALGVLVPIIRDEAELFRPLLVGVTLTVSSAVMVSTAVVARWWLWRSR